MTTRENGTNSNQRRRREALAELRMGDAPWRSDDLHKRPIAAFPSHPRCGRPSTMMGDVAARSNRCSDRLTRALIADWIVALVGADRLENNGPERAGGIGPKRPDPIAYFRH